MFLPTSDIHFNTGFIQTSLILFFTLLPQQVHSFCILNKSGHTLFAAQVGGVEETRNSRRFVKNHITTGHYECCSHDNHDCSDVPDKNHSVAFWTFFWKERFRTIILIIHFYTPRHRNTLLTHLFYASKNNNNDYNKSTVLSKTNKEIKRIKNLTRTNDSS
ncbi:hypothetical protein BDA99DRAFT_577757 [Phascolomyces articulosus]|uniref:Uncharacterized protein n=1 Tax=Phascolomyces articulosus TaxID=60185 RepID=A0AAD5KBL4_9FUNG|nr:hypothetical protein BDA99DRAFT_577757 [Phascolomyces articulosus]